jgi:hypothetical protein
MHKPEDNLSLSVGSLLSSEPSTITQQKSGNASASLLLTTRNTTMSSNADSPNQSAMHFGRNAPAPALDVNSEASQSVGYNSSHGVSEELSGAVDRTRASSSSSKVDALYMSPTTGPTSTLRRVEDFVLDEQAGSVMAQTHKSHGAETLHNWEVTAITALTSISNKSSDRGEHEGSLGLSATGITAFSDTPSEREHKTVVPALVRPIPSRSVGGSKEPSPPSSERCDEPAPIRNQYAPIEQETSASSESMFEERAADSSSDDFF